MSPRRQPRHRGSRVPQAPVPLVLQVRFRPLEGRLLEEVCELPGGDAGAGGPGRASGRVGLRSDPASARRKSRQLTTPKNGGVDGT